MSTPDYITIIEQTVELLNRMISEEYDKFLEAKAKYEAEYMSRVKFFEAKKQEIIEQHDFHKHRKDIIMSTPLWNANKVLKKYNVNILVPCDYTWNDYCNAMKETKKRYQQIDSEYKQFLEEMKPYKDAFHDARHTYQTRLGELQDDIKELEYVLKWQKKL